MMVTHCEVTLDLSQGTSGAPEVVGATTKPTRL